MIVKVCGMRDAENIRQVEAAGADMMGFIFYRRSPRYAGEMPPAYLPECKRVGVFVDMAEEEICRIAADWGLTAVQLHGSESPELCKSLRDRGLVVVKAIPIGKSGLPQNLEEYQAACDLFLFDTQCAGHGGSGRAFDWLVLDDYQGDVPFLLSGGINPGMAEAVLNVKHPMLAGVDLNSGFETEPGLKDASKLTEFIKQLKYNESHK